MVSRNHFFAALSVLGVYFGALATPNTAKDCDVRPQPPNVVAIPTYGEGKDCSETAPTQEKVQYEPMTDERPIFRKQVSQEEIRKGAKYPKATELYVDPEPEFVSIHTPLTEADETEAEPKDDAP